MCIVWGGFLAQDWSQAFLFLDQGSGKTIFAPFCRGRCCTSVWQKVCLGDAVPLFTPQNVSCSQQSWSEQMQFLFGGVPP